jgi:hypothetical protein
MEIAASDQVRPAAAAEPLFPAGQAAGAIDQAGAALTSAGLASAARDRATPPVGRRLVATLERRPVAALTAGAALGLLADLLFYRRPPGVSVPLFVLALAELRQLRAEGQIGP